MTHDEIKNRACHLSGATVPGMCARPEGVAPPADMRIGIIGAGKIGGTLTRRLSALGHDVHVANPHDSQTLANPAAETGATAVRAADAATDTDLVIVNRRRRTCPTSPTASSRRRSLSGARTRSWRLISGFRPRARTH
jgi:hypothetical protein